MIQPKQIAQIAKRYFLISKEVTEFAEYLQTIEDFEISYEIDKFFSKKPLLTTAERNFLNEIKAKFSLVTVNG